MQPEFDELQLAVKALATENPHGEFEAVLSTEAFDRHGEAVVAKAFEPLPESIPVYHQHDWRTGALPVASVRPFYDGEVLKGHGIFASTERGQEMRALVAEGHLNAMSVGFFRQKTTKLEGKPVVTKGELFEASFTGIPINTDARVLAAKALDLELKAGARNSALDQQALNDAHDALVRAGATCAPNTDILATNKALIEANTTAIETEIAAGEATPPEAFQTSETTPEEAPVDEEHPDAPPDAAAAAEEAAAAADEEERERLRLRASAWLLPPI